jgi:hypothetical protein
MISYLIRLFLKISHRRYLIQFMDGLKAIGKPTNVLYPVELLEQAALLGLSGLNNTLAIHSNQHWIWPWWVERQLNPESDDFIPTGVNLLTTNLSFRNWTALSIPGNRLEAMLDPVGMLTLEPFSWSLMPYLIIEDKYFIPSKMNAGTVSQTLHKKSWPEIKTYYHTQKDLQWFSKTKALDFDNNQVLHQKHVLKNCSDEPITVTFGVSIRPYNSLTIGHIHKISCKRNLWKVNGNPAMLMLDAPDFIRTSNRLLGDPIYMDRHEITEAKLKNCHKSKLKSRSGIATGIASYTVTIQPQERISYQYLLTDIHSNALQAKKKFKQWLFELHSAQKTFKQCWKKWSQSGLTISLPDKNIENAFYSVKNHLSVFDDVEEFTPGSFFYHSGWFRDSAFLSLSFDQLGFFEQVRKKFPGYFKLQTWSGYFKSQEGEWDSTGQALFTVITHIRRSGDLALLERYYPALKKGARWINKTRLTRIPTESPHYGLLPAGLSAEHFGPNDHYYWDNFWSLAGLKQLLWCAQTLNKDSDVIWLKNLFIEYSQQLQVSIDAVTDRTSGQSLPCSPYRWMDTAAIGNLAAISPMNLISPDEYWVESTLEYLWKNSVKNGLLFQHIIHSGYNIYLSIQLAKIFLIRQDDRWKTIFSAIISAASSTWTWPEAIHPKTSGGCMGDGDHGWAAAEFLTLIRDMFIFEQGDALYLGAGLLPEWFEALKISAEESSETNQFKQSGTALSLNNASSLFGTVSFQFRKYQEGIVFQWQIIRHELQAHVSVYLICPYLLTHYLVEDCHAINPENTRIKLEGERGEYRFLSIERMKNQPLKKAVIN